MVPILDISLFSTDNFVKIFVEGLEITVFQRWLTSLFVTKTNTRVRNGLTWCVNADTMCSKIVYNVTAQMLWPITLGRRSSLLFVTNKWRYSAIRSKYMKNKPIYGIWKFLILKPFSSTNISIWSRGGHLSTGFAVKMKVSLWNKYVWVKTGCIVILIPMLVVFE